MFSNGVIGRHHVAWQFCLLSMGSLDEVRQALVWLQTRVSW